MYNPSIVTISPLQHRPESAQVGVGIRVIGNDAGERVDTAST